MTRLFLVAVAVLVVALACTGCTGEKQAPVTPVPTTPTPEPTTIATVIPTTAVEAVTTLPPAQQVNFELSKDRVYSTITLNYQGGGGEMFTNKVEMRVTQSTGEVTDYVMANGGKPKRGDTIEAKGTRGADRCEVWITSAGIRYKILDETLQLGGFYGY